jgi:hypothetical protein
MADRPAAPLTGVSEHRWELRKEALTMALYVAICLMASLIVIPESAEAQTTVMGLIGGVTLGLALAHWFAFRVSSRMVGAGTIRSSDVELAGAQLLGAARRRIVGLRWCAPTARLRGTRGRRVPPRLLDLPDRVRRSSRRGRVPPPGRGVLARRACLRGHHCRPEEPAGRALTESFPIVAGRSEGPPCHAKGRTFI